MPFESNTIGSDGIDVRRLDMRVTQGRQAIASPLIRSYEEYVHGFIFYQGLFSISNRRITCCRIIEIKLYVIMQGELNLYI